MHSQASVSLLHLQLMAQSSHLPNRIKSSKPQTFTLFSKLPPELRDKIWIFTLPQRNIEVLLDFAAIDVWGYHAVSRSKRRLPVAFSVSRESRGLCFEQYIPFGKSYIHPLRDTLFISASDLDSISGSIEKSRQALDSILAKHDCPLSKFHTVAVELTYGSSWSTGGDGLLKCLEYFGNPTEILLCVRRETYRETWNRLRDVLNNARFSNGNLTEFVTWPDKVDKKAIQEIRSDLVQNLQSQGRKVAGFEVPQVSKEAYFAYSLFVPHTVAPQSSAWLWRN